MGVESRGRSYKNHFSCAVMPKRQTRSRETGTHVHGQKQERLIHALTIQKYKMAKKRMGG